MLMISALAFAHPLLWGGPISKLGMAPRHAGRLAASQPAWSLELEPYLPAAGGGAAAEVDSGDTAISLFAREALSLGGGSLDALPQSAAPDLAIAGSEETPQTQLTVSILILILLGALLKCITSAGFYTLVSDISYTVFTIENDGRDDGR